MSAPVRWGILGTAKVSNKIAKAISDPNSLSTITAVASRSLDKAREWAQQYKVDTYYGSYEELLDNPHVEVVYIPLPTSMKKEWAIKAASKGKHVLVEKPLSCSNDVDAIIKACASNGVQLMDGTMFVHNLRTERSLEQTIKFGPTRHVDVVVNAPIVDLTNIRFNRELEPAGALGDLGWYCIKAILASKGWTLPSKLTSTGRMSSTGVPISVSSLLEFPDQSTASFSCSFDSSLRQLWSAYSESGNVYVDYFIRGQVPSDPEDAALSPSYTIQSGDKSNSVELKLPWNQGVQMIRCMSTLARGSVDDQWHLQILRATQVQDTVMKSLLSDSRAWISVE